MERENIDKNYKWDLETIYKDKKELDKDFLQTMINQKKKMIILKIK